MKRERVTYTRKAVDGVFHEKDRVGGNAIELLVHDLYIAFVDVDIVLKAF